MPRRRAHDRGRQVPAGRPRNRPRLLVDRREVKLERRASGTAPTKLPSAYRVVGRNLPRLDLPAKLTGEAFIHDIAPADVVHARVLRRPWRGARLAALDENAVRKAAKAPIGILREGDFVAFTADSETAVMRAAAAARTLARWDGGEPAPADVGAPDWLKAQPSRDRTVETGQTGRAPQGPMIEARYSRPFLTYASIGPSCALAELKDGALKVVAQPGPGGAARLAGARARPRTLAGHGAPPPGRRRLRPQHRRRCGLRRRLYCDPDAGPDRAGAVAREDEFASAPISTAMAIELRAVLDADNRPADWTIEIWSPPHAQRPGMNGNSNLIGAEALPNAPARNELNDVPDERGGGADPQRAGDLRPAAPPPDPSPAAAGAAAHLVLRGLGAWANVYAIESFMDELAETAGEDPVSYRLSLLSDPRARRVVETARR